MKRGGQWFFDQLLNFNGKKVFLVQIPQIPIVKQLLLEEALLRHTHKRGQCGWVFYNDYTMMHKGGMEPSFYSIVLGRSQNPSAMVHMDQIVKDNIPLVRRYSAGGTVLLSRDSFTVTFLLPHTFFTRSYPRAIMDWSGEIYAQVFGNRFVVKENDYTVDGLRKFGGNAQAITRDVVSHHTSFIWKPDVAAFQRYLKMPEKQPKYRQMRTHGDFVCGIQDAFSRQFTRSEQVLNQLTGVLREECTRKGFGFEEVLWSDVKEDLQDLTARFLKSKQENQVVNLVDLNGQSLVNWAEDAMSSGLINLKNG